METREQSKQWTEAGQSAPKKAKKVQSAGKIMATVFWDYKSILLIGCLQKGETIISEYYCNLIDELNGNIEKNDVVYDTKNSFSSRHHTSTQECFTNDKVRRFSKSMNC